MVIETTDSCRSALTTLSTTLVFPDAVPPATPMKKGSCLVLGICMPKVITGKNTVVSARVTITASGLTTVFLPAMADHGERSQAGHHGAFEGCKSRTDVEVLVEFQPRPAAK